MELNEVVIGSAVRTPIGSFQGTLSGVAATKLGSVVIAEALKRANLKRRTLPKSSWEMSCQRVWDRHRRGKPRWALACPRLLKGRALGSGLNK